MSRTRRLQALSLLTGVLVVIGLAAGMRDSLATEAPNEAILTGTITSASGERMEGVIVSARGESATFTISVYTDAQGEYYFPPMATGRYKLWAQAVSYEAARTIVGLEGAVQRQNFVLKPLEDFEAQLRGDEWVAALPEATPEDRRMKEVFRMSCGGCHNQNMTLLNRFDEKGWTNIITVMSRISTAGWSTSDDVAPNPLIDYYKERLAAYLAKVRGPGPSPMRLTPRPRPKGEETLMVVREYDGPGNGYGLPLFHDGSDWSLGYPGKLDRKNHHVMDGTLDFDGNVWFSDDLNTNPYRSVAKIDWRTGQVTNIKVPRRSNPRMAAAVHDLVTDHDGILWFGADGNLIRLDPKTLTWEAITPPEGTRAGGFLGVDGTGGIWTPTAGGALRFDPRTRTWTHHKNPTQKSKLGSAATYGAAGDRDGNGWLSQHPIGIMVKHNSRTGKSEDVLVPKRVPETDLFTGEDRRIFQMMGGSLYQGHGHPEEQAIRKPGGGPGPTDAVWGPGWIGDNLVKIDIRTNKAALYPFPWRDAGAYQATVDKDGIVWVIFTNADAVGRFDPTSEQWSMYQLPTLGTEAHGMQVVTVNGRPMLMVPYWAAGKAARLEFRTREELQALKTQAQRLLGGVVGDLIVASTGWAAATTSQRPGQTAAAVEVQAVRYPSAGASLEASLARPTRAGKHPAVIVVHDDQRLTQPMQEVTRLFAAVGFVALAPNLASRASGAAVAQLPLNQTVDDVKAAFAFLREDAGVDAAKISAVGFGWGGWRVFKLAEQTPSLHRAVVFYGTTPSEIDLSRIRAPILGHYAEYDFQTTGNALATKRRLGNRFTYHIYTDADRGFFGGGSGAIDYVALARAQEHDRVRAEDTSTAEGAARLAWARTVAFLQGA